MSIQQTWLKWRELRSAEEYLRYAEKKLNMADENELVRRLNDVLNAIHLRQEEVNKIVETQTHD